MPNIVDIIIAGSIFAAAGIILFRFFKKSKEGKGACPCGSECECGLPYNSAESCHSCGSCDAYPPCIYCRPENIKESYGGESLAPSQGRQGKDFEEKKIG